MKRLLSLALCAASFAATTTPAPAQPALASPPIVGIAHVALRVADLQASIAFYQKLGFIKAFELSKDGSVYEAFIKINDRQFIELYPAAAAKPQVGFLHICFETTDIQPLHDFYVQQGLTPTDVAKGGAGNMLFAMKGPATPVGPENMEYTQYMPGSLHTRDTGLHLGAGRVATSLLGVSFTVDDPHAAQAFYRNRAGFTPLPGGAIQFPGSNATLSFESDPARKFLCVLEMRGAPKQETLARLRQSGIRFQAESGKLRLTDPDGNVIHVAVP